MFDAIATVRSLDIIDVATEMLTRLGPETVKAARKEEAINILVTGFMMQLVEQPEFDNADSRAVLAEVALRPNPRIEAVIKAWLRDNGE